MHVLVRDLRYGFRRLATSPGITLVALSSLAVGICVNTAIFGIVNAVMLRPLPYREPEGLVMLWEEDLRRGLGRSPVAPINFLDWQQRNEVFAQVAAYAGKTFALTTGDRVEQISGARVSADLFPLLGVAADQGRTFLPEEDRQGGPGVVLISHELFVGRFGADRDVIGKLLRFEDGTLQLVGVMPAGFNFPDGAQLWTPIGPEIAANLWIRGSRWLRVIGRLAPGVALDPARERMTAVAHQLEQEHPDVNAGYTVDVVPLREQIVGDVGSTLMLLMAAVGLVLLIAAGNVANLLLAQATARGHEVAVRMAQGADRRRLIRQLITESLQLSVLGGILGVFLAYGVVQGIVALAPENLPRVAELDVDARVLAYSLLLSLVTGVIFGLAPALQASRPDLNRLLKDSGLGQRQGTAGGRRVRSLLVISETALTAILLILAGLMIQSYLALRGVDTGFNPHRALVTGIHLSESRYPQRFQSAAFLDRVLESLETLPSVRRAAATNKLPLMGPMPEFELTVEAASADPGESFFTTFQQVSSEYFRTMGIPLLRGRGFNRSDDSQAVPVAVVSRTLARRFFPGGDAVGQVISVRFGILTSYEIVGVVGDVRQFGLDQEPRLAVYVPFRQSPSRFISLVVRTSSDPRLPAAQVRDRIRMVDADQPLAPFTTLEEIVADSLSRRRLGLLPLALFSLVALIMAMAGVYGVADYFVAQRRQEIGLRMALGAQPGNALWMVVRRAMFMALAGVAVGTAGALALSTLLAGMIYGVATPHPIIFLLAPPALLAAVFLASYIPARRAARVDPSITLRAQ